MKDNLGAVKQTVAYIESHLKEAVNLSVLAGHVGFSKYHFTRIFKEYAGITPYDYFRGRKITETIHYLEANNCKIIDAALEYGFSSPEVFTRSCLTVFNQSPSQIRKAVQSNAFEGLPALDLDKTKVFVDYSHIEPKALTLPKLIIKGISYTTDSADMNIDTTAENVLKLINSSPHRTLYHLQWPTDGANEYHHLVGIIVKPESLLEEDDFSSYIYKQVPATTYLCFPLTKEGKELPHMREFIKNHYGKKNDHLVNKAFHVNMVRFEEGSNTIYNSLTYVPYKDLNSNKY